MLVSVRDINRSLGSSLEINDEYETSFEDLQLAAPLQVKLKLSNTGGSILVKGNIKTKVVLVCSRCASDYEQVLDVPVEELFVSDNADDHRADDDEVRAEDLCVFTYENDTIDLDELFRDNLLSSLPFRPLCSENCKGLCGECGADLNKEACRCQKSEETDPRWDALKKFVNDQPK